MEIKDYLIKHSEPEYKEFICKLTPSVSPDSVLGVRVPIIRSLVKQLSKDEINKFLYILPHKYYEENLLHGFLISKEKNFGKCIAYLEEFLPYINNWAVSDTMAPKCFAKYTKELFPYISKWIKSNQTYKVRFAIDLLMNFYLKDNFDTKYLDMVANVVSDEYYVNMMSAWYFATALTFQYDKTISYIQNHKLIKWVHNKSIQKAIESNRIPNDIKEYLRKLKY